MIRRLLSALVRRNLAPFPREADVIALVLALFLVLTLWRRSGRL